MADSCANCVRRYWDDDPYLICPDCGGIRPDGQRRVIAATSGGLGSFGANVRTVEKYGAENVTALFTDVQQEDEDVYRFLVESCAALGIDLEVVTEGRTPWDVAMDEGFIPNNMVPLCSRILKIEPARAWVEKNAPDALLVYGIGWHEAHREAAISEAQQPRDVWMPMLEPPYLDNFDLARLARSYGVEPPRMYAAGYQHANCAGACFRAGHAAWRLVLRDNPTLFWFHELMEQTFRRKWGRKQAVLKYRTKERDGEPMTLQTFRRYIEAEDYGQLDLLDYGGCGCNPGDNGGFLLQIGRREVA